MAGNPAFFMAKWKSPPESVTSDSKVARGRHPRMNREPDVYLWPIDVFPRR
ncbi:hypothetical protein NST41_33200 [Paenibacillus sp. FSL L8-0696]|uniref:hypothetical protein n=1 Tax=Paenibacillus TaxID=44249 RepID=UPI0012DEDA2E|nr:MULTISPECIES: hypothetical protein [Paenibacillus]